MKRIEPDQKAPDFIFQTPWSKNHRFYDVIKEKTTILLFLRFYGCRICQLDISRLIAGYPGIEALNAQLLVVLQTEPEIISAQDKETDIPFSFLCDPEHALYELYHVGTSDASQPLPSAVEEKIAEAARLNFVKYENNGKEIPTQLPACFIIAKDGTVQYVHYGKDASDVPGPEELINLLSAPIKKGEQL